MLNIILIFNLKDFKLKKNHLFVTKAVQSLKRKTLIYVGKKYNFIFSYLKYSRGTCTYVMLNIYAWKIIVTGVRSDKRPLFVGVIFLSIHQFSLLFSITGYVSQARTHMKVKFV